MLNALNLLSLNTEMSNIITTDKDVMVLSKWITDQLEDEKHGMNHPGKHSSRLEYQIDPDGDRIISPNVFDSPEWNYLKNIKLSNPDAKEEKSIGDWLKNAEFKKYKYIKEDI